MKAIASTADLWLGSPGRALARLPRLLGQLHPAPAGARKRFPHMTKSKNRQPDGSVQTADWLDLQDIRASAQGDGEAYARLVRRHQDAIAAYMWRFTRDQGQWEELVHDVFVEAYLSLRTFRGQAPLLHWLRKIATRIGYRYWKQRARQRLRTPLPIQPWDCIARPDSQEPDAQQVGQLVHAMLQRLAPRDRLVLTLFYLEGCAMAEIARLTGWSQTMVKVQTFRARNRLKRLLQQGETKP